MNVGHTQRDHENQITPPLNVVNDNLQIENVIAVHNIPQGSQYVRVEYDINSTLPNSETYIVDESDGSILFTSDILLGQGSITAFIEPNNASTGNASLACYIHNTGTGDFARLICVGTVDGQNNNGTGEW